MVLVKISSSASLFFLVKINVSDKIQFHVYGIKILSETNKCYVLPLQTAEAYCKGLKLKGTKKYQKPLRGFYR